MPKDIPSSYNPSDYETKIYQLWEESGFLNPDNLKNTNSVYANILPPPNANGELHLGHVSGYVVMDLLGRFNRLKGKKVLLLPGKDHAGIQTQVVFEKKLKKEKGLTRYDLGREKFYQNCYNFCIDRSQYMRNQEKKIGLSADWSREKFTLNPEILTIVLNTFIQMYNEVDKDGNRMIYKGERVINWCPRCATALSDVEVEHQEKETKIYTFKYDINFPFEIATTRPETKLGDTAVAVNPEDERYKDYIGKTIEANFCGIKLNLKIIADKEVDMNFGTGALGVTPAHSLIDWEMAKKNNLKIIKIINEKATIEKGLKDFSDLNVLEARELIIQKLKSNNLLTKEEDFKNNLSVCERCKTAIEPIPSKQWFINVDHANFSLKKEARKIVESGEIKIYPQKFEKIMLDWINNVHDWCISRQIWWGPRIPIWEKDGEIKTSIESPGDDWKQDEDTFDTWFSSGQWAYTTLGYPNNKDYQTFYPSDTMIMGRDILPFWAFRMLILSLYRTKRIPFKNLYFTGLVRDEKGQKMSKSKGNGIEPLEMIKKYGTDAVRLSLLIGSAPGNDMNLGENKIAGYRNFTNKLWNIFRYIITNYDDKQNIVKNFKLENLTLADQWILNKINILVQTVTDDLEKFQFSQAGEKLRIFTWDNLADWYLEVSKFEENKEEKGIILNYCLEIILKLWHPFIPFVTEALWQEMNHEKLLMISEWPNNDSNLKFQNLNNFDDFDLIKNVIIAIRNLRAEHKIQPNIKAQSTIYASTKINILNQNKILIQKMRTNLSELNIQDKGEKIPQAFFTTIGEIEIYLLVDNFNFETEKIKLQKEISIKENQIETLKNRLKNPDFSNNAPEQILKNTQKMLDEKIIELDILKERLKNTVASF